MEARGSCVGSGVGEVVGLGGTRDAVGPGGDEADGGVVCAGEAQAATTSATIAARAINQSAGVRGLIPRFGPLGLVNGPFRLRSHGLLIVATMLDIREKPRIGNVMTLACRSYSALKFDGCPACVDAALDAVVQAGMYTLGRTAPSLAGPVEGPLGMAYVLRVKLVGEMGEQIGADEVTAEQTISAVPLDDEWGEIADEAVGEDEAEEDDAGDHASMQLQDFQTVLDRLEVAPMGKQGLCGTISGRLFGFDRSIGLFRIEVTPAR